MFSSCHAVILIMYVSKNPQYKIMKVELQSRAIEYLNSFALGISKARAVNTVPIKMYIE